MSPIDLFSSAAPILVACAILLVWARVSAAPRLSRVLRSSAFAWGGVQALGLVTILTLNAVCTGDIIYGHSNCVMISDDGARFLSVFMMFSFMISMIYAAALLIIAIVWEVVTRRNARLSASS